MPRRDGGARVEGRVAEDKDDPGRFGLVEAAVSGRLPVAAPSVWNSSPSSEAMSVMREDMMLGARCEPDVGRGLGKELLAGERGVVAGARFCAILTLCALNQSIFVMVSYYVYAIIAHSDGFVSFVSHSS